MLLHATIYILDTSFPLGNPLRKIFNSNTVRLNYSCMPNMQTIITSHNKAVLAKTNKSESTTTQKKKCNCRKKDNCPLSGKCLTGSVVYQATVTKEDGSATETYVGLTEGPFFKSHQLVQKPRDRHATELSKYIWNLKDSKVPHSVSWRILQPCNPYSAKTKRYNLCLHEKYLIFCQPEVSSLNTRKELVTVCRHRKKTSIMQKIELVSCSEQLSIVFIVTPRPPIFAL